MFITEAELRERWKAGTTRFEFPVRTRFSPSALDFIKDCDLEVYVDGERITPAGARLHHYSEGVAPTSFARATRGKETRT